MKRRHSDPNGIVEPISKRPKLLFDDTKTCISRVQKATKAYEKFKRQFRPDVSMFAHPTLYISAIHFKKRDLISCLEVIQKVNPNDCVIGYSEFEIFQIPIDTALYVIRNLDFTDTKRNHYPEMKFWNPDSVRNVKICPEMFTNHFMTSWDVTNDIFKYSSKNRDTFILPHYHCREIELYPKSFFPQQTDLLNLPTGIQNLIVDFLAYKCEQDEMNKIVNDITLEPVARPSRVWFFAIKREQLQYCDFKPREYVYLQGNRVTSIDVNVNQNWKLFDLISDRLRGKSIDLSLNEILQLHQEDFFDIDIFYNINGDAFSKTPESTRKIALFGANS
jgi:hypothetical protein